MASPENCPLFKSSKCSECCGFQHHQKVTTAYLTLGKKIKLFFSGSNDQAALELRRINWENGKPPITDQKIGWFSYFSPSDSIRRIAGSRAQRAQLRWQDMERVVSAGGGHGIYTPKIPDCKAR